MKTPSENDALAIRQIARGMLLTKHGDRLSPKENITVAELRTATAALHIAQKMERRSAIETEESSLNDARDWFMQDKIRTLQEAADKFGIRFVVVRRRSSGEGWVDMRNNPQEVSDD